MNDASQKSSTNPIEAALEAERRAELSVAAAEADAEQRLRAARDRAHGILQRADERMAALRTRTTSMTRDAVARFAAEERERLSLIEQLGEDAERRQTAVARVARWLLGEDDRSGGEPA